MAGKTSLAVLVGCNYPNSRNELHGCINDVLTMKDMLVNRFGFDEQHIELLIDAPGSVVMPTGANIKAALGRMVDGAEAGDVLFFHFSGHGTRIPSLKPFRPFRQDEAIVPCDFNLITDIDFRQLVNRVPKGASFTILSDSCHSGGLIDKEKEQIGLLSLSTDKNLGNRTNHVNFSKPRTLPFQAVMHHLTSLTRINTSDLATHLLELFGADASLMFRLSPVELGLKWPERDGDEGILLSGCQAKETSADVNAGGKAYGAFSNAVQMVLKEEETGSLSNKQVVIMARKLLWSQGFSGQHPCLYCADYNADASFLLQSHY